MTRALTSIIQLDWDLKATADVDGENEPQLTPSDPVSGVGHEEKGGHG